MTRTIDLTQITFREFIEMCVFGEATVTPMPETYRSVELRCEVCGSLNNPDAYCSRIDAEGGFYTLCLNCVRITRHASIRMKG